MDKIPILFLSADPSDAGRLRLGQELRDIREKLQLSKQRDMFQLDSRESARPGGITQAIHDIKPQIVHFSGHGMSTGELCLENTIGKYFSSSKLSKLTYIRFVKRQNNILLRYSHFYQSIGNSFFSTIMLNPNFPIFNIKM